MSHFFEIFRLVLNSSAKYTRYFKNGFLKNVFTCAFYYLAISCFGHFLTRKTSNRKYTFDFRGDRVLVVSIPCQNTPLQGKEVVMELLYVVDYISVLLCDKKTKKKISNKIFTLQRSEPPSYIVYAFHFPTRA